MTTLSARDKLIDQTFNDLNDKGMRILLDTFKAKQGVANPFVQWAYFSKDLLEQAIEHIPLPVLCDLFRVLLKDLKIYRTGMPDLVPSMKRLSLDRSERTRR